MKTREVCLNCIHAEKEEKHLFCGLTGRKCTVKKEYVDENCVNAKEKGK